MKEVVAPILKELEEHKRQQRKNYILDQKKKIGFQLRSRVSGERQDSWEDGEELLNLKQDLEKIVVRKHKIEKLKKSLKKKGKSKSNVKPDENSRITKMDDSYISHVFDYQETGEEAKKRVNF